jgi:hypothetical protein
MITTLTAPEIEPTGRRLADLFAHAALGRVSFKLWDGTMEPDHEPRAAIIPAIGAAVHAPPTRGGSFIQDYVFPSSDLPRLSVVLSVAETARF